MSQASLPFSPPPTPQATLLMPDLHTSQDLARFMFFVVDKANSAKWTKKEQPSFLSFPHYCLDPQTAHQAWLALPVGYYQWQRYCFRILILGRHVASLQRSLPISLLFSPITTYRKEQLSNMDFTLIRTFQPSLVVEKKILFRFHFQILLFQPSDLGLGCSAEVHNTASITD